MSPFSRLLASSAGAHLGDQLAVAALPFALAAACFAGAGGAVILSLCALALVPELVPAERLPAANARLELARAAATLLAPIAAGLLAERASPALGFVAAALACAAAAFAASSLSAPTAASRPAKP